jgi:hypothetical protein
VTQTIASLKADAVAKAGLNDFGDTWFELPLAAWIQDLDGPALSQRGRAFFSRLAIANLCRRLEIIDCLKKNPGIDAVAIPPTLYITGLERSGTTLLHNLLALHPRSHALLRWELMRSTPPPEAATYRNDPRIAEVQASIEPLRGTKLEHMHWVNADEPEECTWGAFDCTGLLGRAPSALMPTWTRWLQTADLTPSFLEYRRLVKLLTWRNPVAPGGHLVLKCPQNSRNIAQFAGAFPEARFVFTHRDPYRAVASGLTLVDHITSAFTEQKYMWQPGGAAVETVISGAEIALNGMVSYDTTSTEKCAHVAYPALVKDPANVVGEIYRHFSINAPEDIGERIASFVTAQARGRRAAPPAELATYGLEQQSLLTRPVFRSYCTRFDVKPETTRLTGA